MAADPLTAGCNSNPFHRILCGGIVALAVIKTVTSEPVAIYYHREHIFTYWYPNCIFLRQGSFSGEIWRDLLIFGQNLIEICQIGGKILDKNLSKFRERFR